MELTLQISTIHSVQSKGKGKDTLILIIIIIIIIIIISIFVKCHKVVTLAALTNYWVDKYY